MTDLITISIDADLNEVAAWFDQLSAALGNNPAAQAVLDKFAEKFMQVYDGSQTAIGMLEDVQAALHDLREGFQEWEKALDSDTAHFVPDEIRDLIEEVTEYREEEFTEDARDYAFELVEFDLHNKFVAVLRSTEKANRVVSAFMMGDFDCLELLVDEYPELPALLRELAEKMEGAAD